MEGRLDRYSVGGSPSRISATTEITPTSSTDDPAHAAHAVGAAARAAARRVRAAAHREAGARAPRAGDQGAPRETPR